MGPTPSSLNLSSYKYIKIKFACDLSCLTCPFKQMRNFRGQPHRFQTIHALTPSVCNITPCKTQDLFYIQILTTTKNYRPKRRFQNICKCKGTSCIRAIFLLFLVILVKQFHINSTSCVTKVCQYRTLIFFSLDLPLHTNAS